MDGYREQSSADTVGAVSIARLAKLISLVVVCGVAIGVLLSLGDGKRRAVVPVVADSYAVTYSVTGSAEEASVTYENESGGTSQKRVRIPWTETFSAAPGKRLYLSAQNQHRAGTIEVKLQLDGKTVQDASSNEEFGIAKVSGRI